MLLNPDSNYDLYPSDGPPMKNIRQGGLEDISLRKFRKSKGLPGDLDYVDFEEQFEEETFKKGGKKYKAKKTPGKFSHKTNPLHIIANGGDKVGEMTGGEYIFNPSQATSLRKHSKSGSSPLHKFVRQMLSKSQFK